MPTGRIPFAQSISSRTGSLAKDSKTVNGYFETLDGVKYLVKRPGLSTFSLTKSLPAGQAQCLTTFTINGYFSGIAVINNLVYQIYSSDNTGNPGTWTSRAIGVMSGTVQQVSFSNILGGGYLFMQNGTNGYTLSSTGVFKQVTNDGVNLGPLGITILTGGKNFVTPVVTFSSPPVGTTATATANLTSGVVTSVTMNVHGAGYLSPPSVSITDGTGSGAVLGATVSGGQVTVVVLQGGSGYSSPTITIDPPGITATGTATINSAGVVTGITVTNAGTGYTSAPTITVTDSAGSGSGFTGTVLLNAFPSGPLAVGCPELDDTTYVAQVNTARLYNSDVGMPYSWNALYYTLSESKSVTTQAVGRQLNNIVTFNSLTTEFFYDAGNSTDSPLDVVPGYLSNIGCPVGTSVVGFENTVVWVGQSDTEGTGVYLLSGTTPLRVSTPSISKFLDNQNLTSMRAWAVKQNGHNWYVLTLHTQNLTFVFDIDEKAWYTWTSFSNGQENYFKAAYFTAVPGYGTYNSFVLGDDDGSLSYFSSSYYSDNGTPIYFRMVTNTIDNGDRNKKFYGRLTIIGDQVPATLRVRHSRDDYTSWSSYRSIDLNMNSPRLFNLGSDRKRAWEFLCIDNQPIRLAFAEIDFSVGRLKGQGE